MSDQNNDVATMVYKALEVMERTRVQKRGEESGVHEKAEAIIDRGLKLLEGEKEVPGER